MGRLLHPGQYGVYAAGSSVVLVVTAFGSFGLDQLLLNGLITEAQFSRSCRSVAAVAMMISAVAVALWPNLSFASRVVGLLVSLAAALSTLRLPWILIPGVRLRFAVRARREMVTRLLTVVAAVGFAAVSRSAIATAVGSVVAGVLLLLAPQEHSWTTRSPIRATSVLLRRGLPYALSGALYSVYFVLDASLLAALRPSEEVGFYRAAYSFVAAAVAVTVVVNSDIMRPKLLNSERASDAARPYLWMSLFLGSASSLALLFLAPSLVRTLYGDAFSPAIAPLQILGLALLPHFVNSWLSNLYMAFSCVRRVLVVQGILVVLNVVGNLYLIPIMGSRGAALMTLVTEVAGVVLYLAQYKTVSQRAARA
jgi:O-antigen/teichoic acid export membrane protein